MKTAEQLALEAGIPVVTRKGEKVARMSDATYDYLVGPHKPIPVGPFCRCLSFRLPHSLERHKELRSERDWRGWEQRGDVGGKLLGPRIAKPVSDVPEEILQEWYA